MGFTAPCELYSLVLGKHNLAAHWGTHWIRSPVILSVASLGTGPRIAQSKPLSTTYITRPGGDFLPFPDEVGQITKARTALVNDCTCGVCWKRRKSPLGLVM